MHIRRSRADSYIGGHTVIQLSHGQVERKLIADAFEARQRQVEAQLSFDAAAAAYRKACDRLICTAEQDADMRRAWARVEAAVNSLRQQCAFHRVRAKKAEQALAKLTAKTK